MNSRDNTGINKQKPKVIFEAYFDSDGDEVTEKDDYIRGERHVDFGDGKIARMYLGPK
jgi:hypothetical protein